jgi:hypothetical protein
MTPARRGAAQAAPEAEVFDLDLDAIETQKEPSFTFRLGGRVFHCKHQEDLQWDMVEKWLVAQATGNDMQIAILLDEFFGVLLYDDEYDAFMEMKRDRTGPLSAGRALQLVQKINTEVFGLSGAADPTPRPAPSGRGSRKSASGSRVKHDGRVTKTA